MLGCADGEAEGEAVAVCVGVGDGLPPGPTDPHAAINSVMASSAIGFMFSTVRPGPRGL